MFFQAFYLIIFRQFEALEFENSNEHNIWEWNVHLHNQDDLADESRQPSFRFGLTNAQNIYYLTTKYLTKESTKSRPCMKYKPTTCKEVEMHKGPFKYYVNMFLAFFHPTHPPCKMTYTVGRKKGTFELFVVR